jgi:hypothetical protein
MRRLRADDPRCTLNEERAWKQIRAEEGSGHRGLVLGEEPRRSARVAGINLSTLKRWLRLPDFQAEYLLVRREFVSQANARIQQNSGALVSVGLKLVADAATPPSVKGHLILGLLDRGNKALEQEDVLVRLAALERNAETAKSSRN